MTLRVVFGLRRDAKTKPGGDTSKVDRYRLHLEQMGVTTGLVYSPAELADQDWDVLHLVNLDLPLENLLYAKSARRSRLPVVLSTVRHPPDGLRAMYQNSADRFCVVTRRASIAPGRAIGLREQIKLWSRRSPVWSWPLKEVHEAQQKLLDLTAAYFPMAEGEAGDLQTDFTPHAAQYIIPNGFNLQPSCRATETGPRRPDVICVGRVEPRKNTVSLVRAAIKAGLSIDVVGGINSRHRAYAAEFRELCDSPGVVFHGRQEQDAVKRIVGRAKCYVNPAWVEVVSQADVEAAALAIPMVSTRYSYGSEFIGSERMKLDPARLSGDDSAQYLAGLVDTAAPAILPAQLPTWSDAARQLLRVYEEVSRG